MKKLILGFSCLFLLSISFAAFSQSEKINPTLVTFRARVGSAIEHLGKEKFYKVIPPAEPEPPKGEVKRFAKFHQGLGLDAKRIKGDEKFDKSFEIVTEGVQSILRYEDQPYRDSIGEGLIRKVFYKLPLKVVVKNAAGETEKELIIVDQNEEFIGIFHANMLAAKMVGGKRPIISFKSEDKMKTEYEANKDAIIKLLERGQVGRLFTKVENAVIAGYGENKFSAGFLYSYALTKDAAASNSELESQCNQLKTSLTELNDKAKTEAALTKLEGSYNYFKTQIEANKESDLKLLYLGNGAIAALVTGHLGDADNWFSTFYVAYGNSNKNKVTDYATLFEPLFDLYAPYYTIKQSSNKEVNLNLKLKGIDDKRKNDEQIARKKKEKEDSTLRASALPVYRGEEGKVELVKNAGVNGQFNFKGKIFYDFNKTYVDGAVKVSSRLEIETAQGKMSFPPRQVLYFEVAGKKYMPTPIRTSGLLAAATLATGDLEDPSFWEVLQENDKAIFLQLPGSERFAIWLDGEKEAYQVDDIIKNRKVAKDFFVKCPQLLDAINKKEIKAINSREDFKEFYKWLENNCK